MQMSATTYAVSFFCTKSSRASRGGTRTAYFSDRVEAEAFAAFAEGEAESGIPMITSHIIPVNIELERETPGGAIFDVERTYSAKVSLVKGTRDELEVEWLSDVGDLDDLELVGAVEKAVGLWWDLMRALDQDSEADQAADAHMARGKAEREEAS